MTTISIITLLATMVVLAAIPSASVALVVTRSVTLGIRNGISVACGIVLGDLIFVALAILGMSFLAETMGSFFVILRYIGGAYLVWIGFNLVRSNGRVNLIRSDASKLSLLASFVSGLLLTLGDIKAILFYASLFPAFVNMSSLRVRDIVGIVAVTIIAVGGVKIFYAYSAQGIANRFQNRKAQKLTQTTAGYCMVGAGAYIIIKA
ncbi:MAG: LysE family translocator [Spirochaetales bacterium]|jgi:threonine/homoserine/homoserine lactone efflux protein|nr:LysE family translocator [Spirochaetales bacterium]